MTNETAKEMLMNNKEVFTLLSDYAVCMDSKTEVEDAITSLYGNGADLHTLLFGLSGYARECGRILGRLGELGVNETDIDLLSWEITQLQQAETSSQTFNK